jgi:hypothetical protein
MSGVQGSLLRVLLSPSSAVCFAGNDRPNGELVNGSKQYAAVIVPSSVPFRSQAGKQKP